MCGICGIINCCNELVRESQVIKLMQLQKHRGPDDEGIFLQDNVGLGFVRLSIIDLSQSGHQPMFSEDQRYVVIFNGEIYNYLELRKELIQLGYNFRTNTDTEVLLMSYLKWGESCLHRFNGMWAFVIFDRTTKKLFGARDRYGVKPFYYLQTQNCFAFASEITPLLSLLPEKPTPNQQSIFDFLVFNRTDQTDQTFFNEIKKLQHGYCFTIETNEIFTSDNYFHKRKWYDLRNEVGKAKGFKDSEEYKLLFADSINLRLRSDVPVGVCLSGGIDSSSIVSVLLKIFSKSDLKAFSAVYKKGQIGDETEYINEYNNSNVNMFLVTPDAFAFQRDLMEFVKAHGEPIPGTSPYAQFKVMQLAKDNVVVTLDGQGADEELAGYHYFFGFYFKDLLSHGRILTLCREISCYLTKHHSLMGIKSFIYFLLPKRVRTLTRVNEKGYLNKSFIDKFKYNTTIASNLYGSKSLYDALLDHFEFKLEHLLKWEDRNSMWFSLESRVPFLDFRLVEKTLATASDLKIKNGMTKFILREAMKGILPEKIRLRRDKIGFGTPQDEWFREPAWQAIITEIIDSDSFKTRGFINPQMARKINQRHLLGKSNASKEIWKWIHLELWFREFIDE